MAQFYPIGMHFLMHISGEEFGFDPGHVFIGVEQIGLVPGWTYHYAEIWLLWLLGIEGNQSYAKNLA